MNILNFAKTALNNLFHGPVTRLYPFKEKQFFERARGHISININECIFCGICQRKCPTAAISVNRDDKNWEIEHLKCVQCRSCVDTCPRKCLNMENAYIPVGIKNRVRESHNARIPDNL